MQDDLIEAQLRAFYASEGFTDEELKDLADVERSIRALENDITIPKEERDQSARMMRMGAFPAIGEKAYYASLPNGDTSLLTNIRWGL